MAEKKYSILLVEDEENLQEALKLNLELEGYEVTGSYDGADALKFFQQEYFGFAGNIENQFQPLKKVHVVPVFPDAMDPFYHTT